MIREGYAELIGYVTYRTGASRNKVWQVLKQYSEVVKEAIRRGDSVDIEGLVKITFTTKDGYIYKNRLYTLNEQVKDISESLGIDSFEVRNIVMTYLKRIQDRIKDGYQVNIKGVCYLIPTEEDGEVYCTTRVSPVLEKPELADFLLATSEGLLLRELNEDDLRFKVDAKEDIQYLYLVAKEQEKELNIREVNI